MSGLGPLLKEAHLGFHPAPLHNIRLHLKLLPTLVWLIASMPSVWWLNGIWFAALQCKLPVWLTLSSGLFKPRVPEGQVSAPLLALQISRVKKKKEGFLPMRSVLTSHFSVSRLTQVCFTAPLTLYWHQADFWALVNIKQHQLRECFSNWQQMLLGTDVRTVLSANWALKDRRLDNSSRWDKLP